MTKLGWNIICIFNNDLKSIRNVNVLERKYFRNLWLSLIGRMFLSDLLFKFFLDI